MKLHKLQDAPNFAVKDIYDRPVELNSFKGKKVMVSFYRNVACPFCNLRVHQLIKRYEEWKDDLQMVFFFESRKEVILRSSFHTGLSPIPIVADAEKQYYTLYGVESSWFKNIATVFAPNMQAHVKAAKELGFEASKKFSEGAGDIVIPADFLIDERGIIQEAFYGKVAFDHLPFEKIEQFLGK